MSDDATTQGGTTPEGDGSEGTQTQTGSTPEDLVASYRKRQAGAEAARQAAEAKAKELEAELSKYRTAAQTDAEKELSELAATKARLEAAERRAAEAETKAEARILDAKYPNARKELPEVTDEVRLAKFEALLAEGVPPAEPPTPGRHNEARSQQGEAGTQKRKESVADIRARLESMPVPEGFLQ